MTVLEGSKVRTYIIRRCKMGGAAGAYVIRCGEVMNSCPVLTYSTFIILQWSMFSKIDMVEAQAETLLLVHSEFRTVLYNLFKTKQSEDRAVPRVGIFVLADTQGRHFQPTVQIERERVSRSLFLPLMAMF